MARLLQQGETVRVLVSGATQQRQAERVFGLGGADVRALDFVHAPTDRSWTRDYLPQILVASGKRAARRGAERAAVKFRFNGWSRYPDHKKDDAAGFSAASHLGLDCWVPLVQHGQGLKRVVLEGGGIEVDGQGTLITSEHCLLTGPYPRNKWLGRERLEQVLKAHLGLTQVLWVGDGVAGDDTSGHVDDFVRFVAPGRLVLCEEKERSDPNHRNFEAAFRLLRDARDARGRKFEIVRLPMPRPVIHGRSRLPASYANFYIGNDCVLVPTFDDDADVRALGILAEQFPGRRVIGVHARDLVLGLGTLHCSTQQEPAPPRRKAR